MELQEGKKERQGIQAFFLSKLDRQSRNFFFVFLCLVVANRPLLSSCGSVIWCQNGGARTRLSVK